MITGQSLLAWIGGGSVFFFAAVSVAYGAFQWLGKKWLENKFLEDLEEFKHEKQKQLESLKIELSARLDRSLILNQREFEVLPNAYRLLNEAHGAVAAFTSPLQTYADVDRLQDAELDDLLNEQGFRDYEKIEIKQARPREGVYRKKLFWKKINDTYEPYRVFHNYLITNAVFLRPEIEKKFLAIRDLMYDALQEARREQEFPDPRPDRWQHRERLREAGGLLIDEIRDDVRLRLAGLSSVKQAEADD